MKNQIEIVLEYLNKMIAESQSLADACLRKGQIISEASALSAMVAYKNVKSLIEQQ